MSFLAVLFALLIEQARPLARGNWMHAGFRGWMRWTSRNLDAGLARHGWMTWAAGVAAPAIMTLLVYWLLASVSLILAFLWSVAILYATLGFRQFSHYFTGIQEALEDGDESAARELLAQWSQTAASDMPRSEIIRHVVEYAVLAAHRHVFGVLGWFSILAAFGLGPAGAVLYRSSEFASGYWSARGRALEPASDESASPALQAAASRAWGYIDYLPARFTALGFAVVGSFEDAIDAWRTYAQRFPVRAPAALEEHNNGVILAATSGAVNIRLGMQAVSASGAADPVTGLIEGFPAAASGREPQAAHLRSIVGLVWRSVVLWMVLLALLTLARLLG
jgi:adenosylcobinamide-phosphate synthase